MAKDLLPKQAANEPSLKDCTCKRCLKLGASKEKKIRRKKKGEEKRERHYGNRRKLTFNFLKHTNMENTNYDVITSVGYLNEKYGLKKSHYIEKFIKCIHRKINIDVSKITDAYVNSLNPWVKVKLFLLLVTLSEKGGPEYWLDKTDGEKNSEASSADNSLENSTKGADSAGSTALRDEMVKSHKNLFPTLTEQIIQHNINQDFTESTYDEDYVFSSIWANFMEGLINHYLEKVIVPYSEMKVCQQLYKPMMKIISLYNEYNELMVKSEKNGFLPSLQDSENVQGDKGEKESKDDAVSQERLERAQKLLWQAREDIPKTISKELTLLSEMYSTLSADEQDYELDEFVCCAEEYIELEYLPALVDVLFANCGTNNFWKIMLVLEPFFYYIEDVGGDDDEDEDNVDNSEGDEESLLSRNVEGDDNVVERHFKPDPRVITLEKICEVAARQKWI
ncbi:CQS_1a_G0031710.mRNA.1.CDS.1 [Saccharomyces cerevisiae]|nr:CQS_1a_G0031710.mRNA.1.CDS.1 [Saccharomyces cerevisiae]CAI7375699.1 CQS_1a_G0031710.mRNA.1.CDS.1 [Saccharomyces cerevisiae]